MEKFKIGVAGAGTMGASIAETFAKFGHEVYLYDIFPEALVRAENLIKLNLETEVSEGLLTHEQVEVLLSKITYGTEVEKFDDTKLLIEAILEKIEVKHEFWSKVSNIVAPDAILASNTSGLSITKIAEVVKNPERFAGMHWINPPHIIPLIEVISGKETKHETAQFIYDVCDYLGKKPVMIKDAPGFALNRIQFAIMRECLHIVNEGIASIEDTDKVMKYALGLRYAAFGPFEVADLGGLDIFYNISSYLFEDLADEKNVFGKLEEAFKGGNYGVKSGKGFYDYSDGKDQEQIRYRDEMYTKIAKLLFDENNHK